MRHGRFDGGQLVQIQSQRFLYENVLTPLQPLNYQGGMGIMSGRYEDGVNRRFPKYVFRISGGLGESEF